MTTDNSRVGPTPGPWRIRENARHSPDECDLSICGDIWVLADINGPQYAHQEANARLIAAAPELLEALEEWLTVGNDMKARKAVRSKARAAIAKARGQS